MTRTLILALLTLAACPAPAPAPAPPQPTEPTPTPTQPTDSTPPALSSGDACTTDADCTVTNFAGCCACPQCQVADPRVLSTTSLAAEKKQCAVMKCDMQRCAAMGKCLDGEPAESFTPACRAKVCVAIKK